MIDKTLQAVVAMAPFAQWSICVRRRDGSVLLDADAETTLPTASVGKILPLLEFARRLVDDPALAAVTVDRSSVEPVAQAGLWRHLGTDAITLGDAAVLISAVSDNLAANALVQHLGLAEVHELGRTLGLHRTAVLDLLREEREPTDEPEFSMGSAAELSRILLEIAHGRLISGAVSARMSAWLRLNTDLSMVAAAFDLDPLFHSAPEQPRQLINKTGGDTGTKADVGVVSEGDAMFSYAAIASWQLTDPALTAPHDRAVLAAMRAVGTLIAAELETVPAEDVP